MLQIMFLCITYNLQSHCVAHMWNCIHLENITHRLSKMDIFMILVNKVNGVQKPSNLPKQSQSVSVSHTYLTLIQPCVSRCCCLEKNIYSNDQKQSCFGGKSKVSA